jgi:AcrR family transcriptional regulator
MDEKPTPISRRARPAKAPLSREAIVTTALALLEREGLEGLSLRKVAAALDTGPASLYVYFANLSDLHAEMLDAAFAEVALPQTRKGNWRARLKSLLTSYLMVLYNKRGLAQLAMMQVAGGPHALRIVETMLDILMEGGVLATRAALAVDALLLHVTAVAAEQCNWRDKGTDLERAKTILNSLSPDEFPLLYASRDQFFTSSPKSRFYWALDVIIDGVLAAPLPDD